MREVALLSTCNRTELYALADDTGDALADWLASHPDAGDLHAYLYRHRDADGLVLVNALEVQVHARTLQARNGRAP